MRISDWSSDVCSSDLGDGGIVGMILQQSPTLMLGQEPHAVAQVGEVGGAIAVETHGMLVVPSLAQPVDIAALHAVGNGCGVGVHVGLGCNGLRRLANVFRRAVYPAGGLQNRRRNGAGRIGMPLDEIQAGTQYLFGMIRPDILDRKSTRMNSSH